MGIISDRIKAMRAGEDYVKHLVFPGEVDPHLLNKTRKSMVVVVYTGFMDAIKGKSREDAWNEFQGRFWTQIVRSGKEDDPDAMKALVNLKNAWDYGYDRAIGKPSRPFGP